MVFQNMLTFWNKLVQTLENQISGKVYILEQDNTKLQKQPTEKKKKSTQLRKLPTHKHNPFIVGSELQPEQKKRTEIIFNGKQAMQIVNRDTGEVLSLIHISEPTRPY